MKPNQIEDQHIREQELNRRLQKLEAEQRATAESEKRRLKELHWMHCPKCGQKLATDQYGSVEIDVCPSCRGLWLDANELETILASESGLFRSCLKIVRGR
jgi:acetyl-CoA carboxylase beta subunit